MNFPSEPIARLLSLLMLWVSLGFQLHAATPATDVQQPMPCHEQIQVDHSAQTACPDSDHCGKFCCCQFMLSTTVLINQSLNLSLHAAEITSAYPVTTPIIQRPHNAPYRPPRQNS